MAVALRLNRQGTKDRPYYKIVAVDQRKRRDGRFIEQLGTYDPMADGTNFEIDLAAADRWLSVGARPSDTVRSLIRKARSHAGSDAAAPAAVAPAKAAKAPAPAAAVAPAVADAPADEPPAPAPDAPAPAADEAPPPAEEEQA